MGYKLYYADTDRKKTVQLCIRSEQILTDFGKSLSCMDAEENKEINILKY